MYIRNVAQIHPTIITAAAPKVSEESIALLPEWYSKTNGYKTMQAALKTVNISKTNGYKTMQAALKTVNISKTG